MAHVISFTPRISAPNQGVRAAQEAAVIIFPGVRYERMPDQAAGPTPPQALPKH